MSERPQSQNGSRPGSERLLVDHDRLMERDALARALRLLRPRLSIHAIAPQTLRREILTDPPAVVFVTSFDKAIEDRVPVWILLHEGGSRRSVVSIAGERTEHDDLGLPCILAILDQVTA